MAYGRFRADPEKVRVSIRRQSAGWLATVSSRVTGHFWSSLDKDPEKAVFRALKNADGADLAGIDLDMQWAYDHPWKSV